MLQEAPRGRVRAVHELVTAELIDQVGFTPRAEYAFRHPLIRAVAYESQLRADRAEQHRKLAATIQRLGSADENAALIAEHLTAAEDLHAAFDWHMRAGTWLTHRDLAAARASWQRARDVADRLPAADQQRLSMRIAPRTLLCASAWMAGGSMADTGFDELRKLTGTAGDKVSLAIGMAGWVSALTVHAGFRQASYWASQLVDLLESIGDRPLTIGLLYAAATAKLQCGDAATCRRLSQRAIDLADGDATVGNLVISSRLTGAIMIRVCARGTLGDPGWRADIERSAVMVRDFGVTLRAVMLVFKYSLAVNGALLPDAAARMEAAEVLETAERSGDDFTLSCARYVRGLTLLMHDGPERGEGIKLLVAAREAAVQERFTMAIIGFIDVHLINEKIRVGDLDNAVEFARTAVEADYRSGGTLTRAAGVSALVEALLRKGAPADIREAQDALERLAAEPTEPGFIIDDLWLLRMRDQLAHAHGDDAAYRDYCDRYREMANSVGYEGHVAWAKEMA